MHALQDTLGTVAHETQETSTPIVGPNAHEYRADTLLIVAEGAAARLRTSAAAARAGLPVAATLDIEAAMKWLELGRIPSGVLLDVETVDPGSPAAEAFERLLTRLDEAAASARFASVVSTGGSLIDIVAALAPHERIEQLVDAGEADLVVALEAATRPLRAGVRESSGRTGQADQLRALSREVGRISTALARLSSAPAPLPDDIRPRQTGDTDPGTADHVRALIRARQARARHFDPALFADPAWDMLLDLMVAHLEDKRVAVSSLCIAAAVPPTTALRWIKVLTDHGLFVRRADPADGRRVFIELSDGAAEAMRQYLETVRAA